MTVAVQCAECVFFEPYDQDSKDKLNGGRCRQYEHYKAKGLAKADIDKLVRLLGGHPEYPSFSGGSVRNCEKFIEIKDV